MWFTTFIFRNLTRRPLRSLLTAFAVAIAIGSVIALVGVASGFEQTFLTLYANAGVDLTVIRSGARQRLNSTLDERLGDKIQQIDGVREVLAGLADMVSFQEAGLYSVLVQGWEPQTAIFNHLKMKEGRSLVKGDKRAVLLGVILAGNLGKTVGDEVEVVEGEKYRVVGIYESNNIFENGALVMPIKELQRLMDRQGKVTGFSLILDNPHDTAAVQEIRRRIEALAPGLSALTTEDHVKSISEIRLAKGMAWLTSSIALFIGFFGMLNTMVMSVHERMHEIGVLRALGWRMTARHPHDRAGVGLPQRRGSAGGHDRRLGPCPPADPLSCRQGADRPEHSSAFLRLRPGHRRGPGPARQHPAGRARGPHVTDRGAALRMNSKEPHAKAQRTQR